MKNKEIKFKVFSGEDFDGWVSFDKNTFELLQSANKGLAEELADKDKMIEELKQQLAEKDEEIETLKKKLKSTQIVNDSFLCIVQNHKDFNNIVNEVLLQVKPIKLRTQIANDFFRLIAAKEQQLRHQVCEEIREKAFRDCIGLKESKNFYHYVISPEILDQIEGEKEC